ncbi:MAG TPA: PIN domain-containing protein [Thermoanaerobaculia bacterium]
MIVLVDTDVLIDLALNRAPNAEPAAHLLDLLERRPGTAFVAWHSLANFYYVVSPIRGKQPARDFLIDLARFIEVASTTTESLLYAGQLDMPDFEDAMQVAAALACRAGLIATRNLRHYKRSPVRAAEPRTVVEQLLGN